MTVVDGARGESSANRYPRREYPDERSVRPRPERDRTRERGAEVRPIRLGCREQKSRGLGPREHTSYRYVRRVTAGAG